MTQLLKWAKSLKRLNKWNSTASFTAELNLCFKTTFSRVITCSMFSVLPYQWKAGGICVRETMLSYSCRQSIPTKIICQGSFGCLRQNSTQISLNTKGEFVGSELKWRKWQGCLARRLFLSFPLRLVSACLYSLLQQSFPNTEQYIASESLQLPSCHL